MPGRAREVVDELTRLADGAPVVRVQIDDRHATLTFIDKTNRPHTITWQDGETSIVDEGTDFVVSASFDPRVYDLDHIDQMFQLAAQLSGSDSRQQLQITEYNDGKVLMTVTTNPESTTVFFRPDATVILPLNYRTADGIADGLADATTGLTWVLAVAISSDGQLWVDAPGEQRGTTERMTRPAGLPAFKSVRSQTITDLRFQHERIDPVVIARLVNQLPVELGKPGTPVNVVIVRHPDDKEPRMTFDVGGAKIVTDLAGQRLTSGTHSPTPTR